MDYKEKLRLAKEALGSGSYDKETIEYIFPELKESESEDKRVRKAIFKALSKKDARDVLLANGVQVSDALTWLEKQGEQKPNDEVELKFEVGDWITDGTSTFQIINIDDEYYLADDGDRVCFGVVHQYYHLWTIKDAKDGDVLEFGDHGRLVVGIISFVNKTTGKVDVSCLLEDNNFKVGNYYALDTVKPHPATKEQRDLLFSKMKESGYEWDAEKKKLNKIEQKMINEHNEHEPTSYEVEKWNEAYEKGYETGYMNGKIEQKPAWSEESKQRIESIIATLMGCVTRLSNYGNLVAEDVIASLKDDIDWLKSLKERMKGE